MLYVKRIQFTCSVEAAQFIRDALFDTADYVEDQLTTEPDAPRVIAEIRDAARSIDCTILTPATPSEYDEILKIVGGS